MRVEGIIRHIKSSLFSLLVHGQQYNTSNLTRIILYIIYNVCKRMSMSILKYQCDAKGYAPIQ